MLSQYSNTFFPISSFFISVFLFCLYFCKNNVKNEETNIYSKLVICGLVESFYYVLLTFAVDFIYNEKLNMIFEILNKGLGIIYMIWMALLLYYTICVSNVNGKNKKIYRSILISATILFSVIILLLPINLWYDPIKYQSNSHGAAIDFLYAIVALYLFSMFFIVLFNYKKEEIKVKYVPLYILFVLISISLLLRALDPLFNITSNILSLVLLVMYNTIENPDIKMLEYAEIAAAKANFAKTDFLSSMSHEIRTPLNAIVGFSECIKNSDDINEIHQDAEDVIEASQTLLEIVNGILDISKIESGKLEIVNSPYNSKDLFNHVGKLIKPKMEEKALDFQISISEDIPNTLYGDHANIKKVITNILSNAAKYTEKGFVKYEVRCINNNNVCRLVISVEDTGRGIKQENINKLFSKFQRLDEDKNTTIEGTGLGLAITKQLVELMGGKIVVQSVYGSGSKFTVIIDQRIEKVEVVEEKEDTNVKIDLSNKRILIVDDNQLNIKVASKILEQYNPIIDTCDNGYTCIEKIKNQEYYDLILLDDMMPKISGVETLKELKNISGFNMTTVALTANAISGMREKYISEGFDNYLAKPINKEELKKILIKYLVNNDKKVDFGELPKEIYEIATNEELENDDVDIVEEETTDAYDLEFLKENDIDVDSAIELLGDIDMYNETINDFISNNSTRFEKLSNCLNDEDMENYAIDVHALKSDSKYLGFTKLAEIAYKHEMESKNQNVEYIKKNYDKLKKENDRIMLIIKKYISNIN